MPSGRGVVMSCGLVVMAGRPVAVSGLPVVMRVVRHLVVSRVGVVLLLYHGMS